MSENESNYAQSSYSELKQHSDSIKMDANPSYGVTMPAEDRITLFCTSNSDTNCHQSSCTSATKQYDYAYAHANNTKSTGDGEYGVINQPHNWWSKLWHYLAM